MPRKPQPWFRFYVETVGDPKIRRIPFEKRWLWAAILSAARESPRPGWLYIAENVPMTFQELADYAGAPLRIVRPTLEIMGDLDMVETVDGVIHVINFDTRQFESDNVTARTRTHRERSKERSAEQRRNVRGNTPETETETDTDNRNTYVDLEGGRTSTREGRPPEFCDEHPNGTTRPCRACGIAREAVEAFDRAMATRDARARDARIRAATNAAIDQDLHHGLDVDRPAARQALATARAATRRQPIDTTEPPAPIDTVAGVGGETQ